MVVELVTTSQKIVGECAVVVNAPVEVTNKDHAATAGLVSETVLVASAKCMNAENADPDAKIFASDCVDVPRFPPSAVPDAMMSARVTDDEFPVYASLSAMIATSVWSDVPSVSVIAVFANSIAGRVMSEVPVEFTSGDRFTPAIENQLAVADIVRVVHVIPSGDVEH